MSRYTLTHLTDSTLLRDLKTLVSQERGTTALLIAHLAEVDARRLYAPAGYPSLFEWCVAELRFSEDAAYKRIRVARMAREFPAIYDMLADGRLHLTAVMTADGVPDGRERGRSAGRGRPPDQGRHRAAAGRALPPAGSADARYARRSPDVRPPTRPGASEFQSC